MKNNAVMEQTKTFTAFAGCDMIIEDSSGVIGELQAVTYTFDESGKGSGQVVFVLIDKNPEEAVTIRITFANELGMDSHIQIKGCVFLEPIEFEKIIPFSGASYAEHSQ